MIKLSDYVIKFLARKGVTDVFMISGGGIIHLVDSVGKNKDINYFCNYNEQASAYCCEGYARQKSSVSVCLVTTGPGSTNAISGVASAWVDSVPVIVISGQVKKELMADYSKLRQIGEQEINIIDMVKPITKYAKTIIEPETIGYELEKAFHLALEQRPGPAWLNIPLDVQGSFIKEEELSCFNPPEPAKVKSKSYLKNQVSKAVEMLESSKRPLVLCGQGIRLAGAQDLLEQVLEKVHVPVVLSFNAMDLIADSHPLFMGKPGIIGQRRANFAVQNCDCLLSIGSRLNIKIVGYDYKGFAPKAKKIIVDIDKEELNKPTILPDISIQADARDFLEEFLNQVKRIKLKDWADWLKICESWKKRYPNITKEFFKDKKHVNTYVFFDRLSDLLNSEDTVVTGNGLAALNLYQAFKAKPGQRAFTNNGYGAMGWGLPASIGACIANNRKRVICVTGDGSIQMNIQELEFIKYHKLPVKIFVINNSGYVSIRLTQENLFDGCYAASGKSSGVGLSDFEKIARAYGLGYERILTNAALKSKIKKVLDAKGPVLCELNVSARQGVTPKVTAHRRKDGTFESKPLEDMFPFLPRKELKENMSISL